MSCLTVFVKRSALTGYAITACDEPLGFRSPPFTASKLARLKGMALHNDPHIRARAAGDPHLPEDYQYLLAGDEDVNVRRWACRNPSATVASLQRLTEDEDPGIRAYALLRLGDERDRVIV